MTSSTGIVWGDVKEVSEKGITVEASESDVDVNHAGDVKAEDKAVTVVGANDNTATVKVDGNIEAGNENKEDAVGVDVETYTGGAASVETGDINVSATKEHSEEESGILIDEGTVGLESISYEDDRDRSKETHIKTGDINVEGNDRATMGVDAEMAGTTDIETGNISVNVNATTDQNPVDVVGIEASSFGNGTDSSVKSGDININVKTDKISELESRTGRDMLEQNVTGVYAGGDELSENEKLSVDVGNITIETEFGKEKGGSGDAYVGGIEADSTANITSKNIDIKDSSGENVDVLIEGVALHLGSNVTVDGDITIKSESPVTARGIAYNPETEYSINGEANKQDQISVKGNVIIDVPDKSEESTGIFLILDEGDTEKGKIEVLGKVKAKDAIVFDNQSENVDKIVIPTIIVHELDGAITTSSKVETESDKKAISELKKNIYYTVDVKQPDGGNGNITITSNSDVIASNGLKAFTEGSPVHVNIDVKSGFEISSVSGGKATLTKNDDGTYTLTVPEGGGIDISAVIEAIKQTQEEPKNTVIEVPSGNRGGSSKAEYSRDYKKASQKDWPLSPGYWDHADNGSILEFWIDTSGQFSRPGWIYAMDHAGAKDEHDKPHWYYIDQYGYPVTGWQYIDGYFYYFSGENDSYAYGAMYHGQQTPDGAMVDEDGRRIW